jgi:hypothetical protein
MRLVDARAGRFEQGVVVVILLFGFVFSQAWSIPVAGIVALLGTALGDRSPGKRLWRSALAPRLHRGATTEPEPVARMQMLLVTAGLLLASLLLLVSVGLAAVVAALVAVVAALGATGVFNAAAGLRRRAQRKR